MATLTTYADESMSEDIPDASAVLSVKDRANQLAKLAEAAEQQYRQMRVQRFSKHTGIDLGVIIDVQSALADQNVIQMLVVKIEYKTPFLTVYGLPRVQDGWGRQPFTVGPHDHIHAVVGTDTIPEWAKPRVDPEECTHEWVNARNEAIASGEVCLKCFAIRGEDEQEQPADGLRNDLDRVEQKAVQEWHDHDLETLCSMESLVQIRRNQYVSSLTDEIVGFLLKEFDKAFESEIQRVSTLSYNSHEVCRHFAAELRKRIADSLSETA